ncbi:ankyrin repeat family protein, partial [Wolbachia pipientis wVitA]
SSSNNKQCNHFCNNNRDICSCCSNNGK